MKQLAEKGGAGACEAPAAEAEAPAAEEAPAEAPAEANTGKRLP